VLAGFDEMEEYCLEIRSQVEVCETTSAAMFEDVDDERSCYKRMTVAYVCTPLPRACLPW
jgi:hypothetical protein